ncbi:hypothetical protein LEMLEM_LOCUS20985, partial [Lemmus lemmus]
QEASPSLGPHPPARPWRGPAPRRVEPSTPAANEPATGPAPGAGLHLTVAVSGQPSGRSGGARRGQRGGRNSAAPGGAAGGGRAMLRVSPGSGIAASS